MATVTPETQGDRVDTAWQNISGLKLCLHNSVHFYQHHYRGKPWLVIADQQQESYFRCSPDAEQFLRLLDGNRSIKQAYAAYCSLYSESAISLPESSTETLMVSPLTQQDIVLLIANLKTSHLLADDESTDDTQDASQASFLKKTPNPWLRPFSIKFALLDPDRFLNSTLHFVKPLLGKPVMIIWLLLTLTALTFAFQHWSELVEHGHARFNDPKNLMWYWLLYPLIKTLHEFGHAYTTKLWGGVVHEIGIMLLVFFPVPYVDSSAAHRFSSKRQRMIVSAAGIMVEVFLASLALILWVNTDAGIIHDIAFDIIMIGGVSTLLFNANPLMRFDGYYILCELIEIPNLGTRSTQYLGFLFRKYVLAMDGLQSPVTAKGEEKWLFVYGLCSAIYRFCITLFIVFWVAGKFFIIGVVLALWAIVLQIIVPVLKWLTLLLPQVRAARRMNRLVSFFAAATVLILLLLLTPIGHSTHAEGVVKLPENALIRAGTDGIITRVLVQDNDTVETGSILLILDNPELATRKKILEARLEETTVRQKEALLLDRTRADISKTKVLALNAELNDVQKQIENLKVRCPASGSVALPLIDDLPGRYIKRGEVIGYIADFRQVNGTVVIAQSDITAVREADTQISARFESRPDEILTASFLRELPQVTGKLPSRLLGTGAGGDIAVDTRDREGLQAMSNIYQVEIALPLRTTGNYLGQRIYVRFAHQPESISRRLLRRIKQRLLQAPFV